MGEATPTPPPVQVPVPPPALGVVDNIGTVTSDSPGSDGWKPTKRFLLAFMSLLTIVAAVAIESTSLPTALPIMSAELGGTALEAFWSGTGYLLASTIIQPTVASMSHVLGRKVVCLYIPFSFATLCNSY
jgi:hypothetical protein